MYYWVKESLNKRRRECYNYYRQRLSSLSPPRSWPRLHPIKSRWVEDEFQAASVCLGCETLSRLTSPMTARAASAARDPNIAARVRCTIWKVGRRTTTDMSPHRNQKAQPLVQLPNDIICSVLTFSAKYSWQPTSTCNIRLLSGFPAFYH